MRDFNGDRNPFYGKKHSEEVRQKMSDDRKGKPLSESHKDHLRKPNKKKRPHFSEEHRRKISEAVSQRVYSEVQRQKMSESMKKKWADPEYRAKLLPKLPRNNKVTMIEIILGRILREMFPNEKIYEQYVIDNYVVDFARPGARIIYEADGDYWHSRPGVKERQEKRDQRIESLGWRIMRFGEDFLLKWKIKDDLSEQRNRQQKTI